MLTGEYLRASWSYYNFNAISLKGGQYLPALGELIKLYKKTPAMQKLSGFWWSSTPADKTKFWAYDGSRVKALDIMIMKQNMQKTCHGYMMLKNKL